MSFRRRRHRHLLYNQASNNHNLSPPVVLFLSTRLPSCMSSSDPTCSHARITPSSMLVMSRRNMVFNLKLGRSTSDCDDIGPLNFSRFIISAFVHNLDFNKHDLQPCFWRLRRRVAVSLAHAWSDLLLSRVLKAHRLLFCMHRAQFLIASCAHILLNLGVPDVRTILQIQTYRTRFLDNHFLHELLNLSCKHAVARDECSLQSTLQLQRDPYCELCSR